MKSIHTIAVIFFAMFCSMAKAQDMEDLIIVDGIDTLKYELRLQRYMFREPYIFEGDTMYQYLLPELPVYAPLKFKNKRQSFTYDDFQGI